MAGRHDDAGADGLFSKVIIEDLLLDQLHDMPSKEANHCQIHSRIHQAERIPSSDDTIKRRQILESSTNNLNFRMGSKPQAKRVTEFLTSIYENQSHWNGEARRLIFLFSRSF